MSTVPKTIIKMFNMSTLRCSNWSQAFTTVWLLLNLIRQT